MVISTKYYLINVITKPEVAEHLVPNIRNFEIVYYSKEEFKGGKPGEPEEKNIVRIQMLCTRGKLGGIMTYLQEHYIKRYGAACYYEEVNVPM
jgi:hypothetical protein